MGYAIVNIMVFLLYTDNGSLYHPISMMGLIMELIIKVISIMGLIMEIFIMLFP